jgi:hypothetical protein
MGGVFRQMLENVADEISTLDAFRFPLKVQNKSVPETGERHGPNIVKTDVKTSREEGPHLAREH